MSHTTANELGSVQKTLLRRYGDAPWRPGKRDHYSWIRPPSESSSRLTTTSPPFRETSALSADWPGSRGVCTRTGRYGNSWYGIPALDDRWLGQLKTGDSIFLVASGVLYYLEEVQVKAFLIKLANALPGSEILFDACSSRGLEIANRKVIKAGGMDDSAILRWGIRRAKDMERWDSRIAVVAEYPMFRNMRRALSIREKWWTLVCDALNIMSMVHLRLGGGRP